MGRGWDQPWASADRPGGGEARSRRGGGSSRSGGWSGGRGGGWSSGPPPWVQGLINLTQNGGGPGGPRGSRVRRGDVRAAILDVLAVEPMNGYQVIQQIAERTGGAWKPSPGSVYPTVQQLEDEGLVDGVDSDRRRLLTLTDEGRAYVEAHPDELAATWRAFDDASDAADDRDGTDLKPAIGQVMGAVWQIVSTGTQQQQAEAAEILSDTRRRLYGLLAEGDPE
jgi:DNA-binding PadR family transcriptional regulator